MDIDWEVEIGGDAPVIDVDWPGFIDLRSHPERIDEITEAATCAPLKDLLVELNSSDSPVWTSKCDRWEPDTGSIACYIDLLPREPNQFAVWTDAENFCRAVVERMMRKAGQLPGDMRRAIWASSETDEDTSVTLVVRQAAGHTNHKFAITAYLSAENSSLAEAVSSLQSAMTCLSNAILAQAIHESSDSKLK